MHFTSMLRSVPPVSLWFIPPPFAAKKVPELFSSSALAQDVKTQNATESLHHFATLYYFATPKKDGRGWASAVH
jgi:hypothetical protein